MCFWWQELVEYYQSHSLKESFKLLDTTLKYPYKSRERSSSRTNTRSPGKVLLNVCFFISLFLWLLLDAGITLALNPHQSGKQPSTSFESLLKQTLPAGPASTFCMPRLWPFQLSVTFGLVLKKPPTPAGAKALTWLLAPGAEFGASQLKRLQ